jgi:5-methylcytosine-specific restriction endonuclease McrA
MTPEKMESWDKKRIRSHLQRERKLGLSGQNFTADDFHKLWRAQDGCCNACGALFDQTEKGRGTIDHIHPVSQGGTLTKDNIQLLCWACNQLKGSGSNKRLMQKLRERDGVGRGALAF